MPTKRSPLACNTPSRPKPRDGSVAISEAYDGLTVEAPAIGDQIMRLDGCRSAELMDCTGQLLDILWRFTGIAEYLLVQIFDRGV